MPHNHLSHNTSNLPRHHRIIHELDDYIPAARLFDCFRDEPNCVFLDSSLVNDLGRFSIIGRLPYLKLIKEADRFTANGITVTDCSFEDYLRAFLDINREPNETELPMVSGAIGYFTYDYGRKLQGVPSSQPEAVSIPDAILTFYDFLIIEDCLSQKVYLIANGVTCDAEAQISDAVQSIDAFRSVSIAEPAPGRIPFPIQVRPNFEREAYKQTIDRMIRYIVEGDIYIANMTQQLVIQSAKNPYDVFCDLRKNNPSPFGGYLDYGDFQIICASPERFLNMHGGCVRTRPIKGTRKRGKTPEEDLMMRQELEQSEKDKSELLMIVDLERNDLNRVCIPGSVKVTELFTVETYATVFHLVSDIEGKLLPDCNVVDLLEATFPGGSITGAPKYRAMEIIDELEHGKRGLYTGSIGYLSLSGDCDFNIVIRTAIHKDGVYHLGVGGGITAESDLAFEYEETLQKARAILDALQ